MKKMYLRILSFAVIGSTACHHYNNDGKPNTGVKSDTITDTPRGSNLNETTPVGNTKRNNSDSAPKSTRQHY